MYLFVYMPISKHSEERMEEKVYLFSTFRPDWRPDWNDFSNSSEALEPLISKNNH